MARDPQLFRHFLSANQGDVPLGRMPRGSSLRLLGELVGNHRLPPDASFGNNRHALRHPS